MGSLSLKIRPSDLPQKEPFSRRELLNVLLEKYPNYSSRYLSLTIAALLKNQVLFRAGFDAYTKRPLLRYNGPEADPLTDRVRRTLLKSKDIGPSVVFNSSDLNEWLNELIAHPTVLVEVDRRTMEYVFEILKKSFPKAVVLFNPSLEERTRYSETDTIVIFPLFSRPPLLKRNGKISLEKLAVDVLADRGLRQFFSLDESMEIVLAMLTAYSYDRRALLAYAERRHVRVPIQKLIRSSKAPAIKTIK
jgi:hypothetical protein